jgi:hypothetical protein
MKDQTSYAQLDANPIPAPMSSDPAAARISCLAPGFIVSGTITAAPTLVPDIVFHPGPNETRFTAKGMIYRGELIEDAGAAHALLMAVLSGQPVPPPVATNGDAPFPERDPAKPAEQQGLFHKFDVRRTDGSDVPGGKHHGCRYFVIDLDHDLNAGPTMRAYARACSNKHPQLAADLVAEFGMPQPPSSAKVHPSVWADPVLNLMREARDTMIDFGPRGTQFEIIADIDKIIEQGVPERTPNQLPPTRSGTHTFAALEVSAAAFDEIATSLRAARYDHAFIGDIIDMTNIGLDRRAT